MSGAGNIVVVGAGIAGLATAYHLARRGVGGVVVLEREDAPGLHSSAKSAAIFRTAVPELAIAALTRASTAFLSAPPAEHFGTEPLLDGRGLVLLAGPDGAAEVERMIRASEAPAESLDAARLSALAPEFHHAHGESVRAWLFPHEGRIDFVRLLAGLDRGARAAGATIRTDARVEALVCDVQDAKNAPPVPRVVGVRLASGETIHAEQVVLAAGAWAGALGAAAGSRVALQATRRHLAIEFPDATARPDAPVVWDLDAAFYARPERGGWLVCVCDQSPVRDPDALAPDADVLARLRETASRFLGAAARREEAWCGLRTMTADDEFAIGPDPDVDGLFWVAGLGGAGMGAGWAAGELASALLTGDAPPLAAQTAPGRLARP